MTKMNVLRPRSRDSPGAMEELPRLGDWAGPQVESQLWALRSAGPWSGGMAWNVLRP